MSQNNTIDNYLNPNESGIKKDGTLETTQADNEVDNVWLPAPYSIIIEPRNSGGNSTPSGKNYAKTLSQFNTLRAQMDQTDEAVQIRKSWTTPPSISISDGKLQLHGSDEFLKSEVADQLRQTFKEMDGHSYNTESLNKQIEAWNSDLAKMGDSYIKALDALNAINFETKRTAQGEPRMITFADYLRIAANAQIGRDQNARNSDKLIFVGYEYNEDGTMTPKYMTAKEFAAEFSADDGAREGNTALENRMSGVRQRWNDLLTQAAEGDPGAIAKMMYLQGGSKSAPANVWIDPADEFMSNADIQVINIMDGLAHAADAMTDPVNAFFLNPMGIPRLMGRLKNIYESGGDWSKWFEADWVDTQTRELDKTREWYNNYFAQLTPTMTKISAILGSGVGAIASAAYNIAGSAVMQEASAAEISKALSTAGRALEASGHGVRITLNVAGGLGKVQNIQAQAGGAVTGTAKAITNATRVGTQLSVVLPKFVVENFPGLARVITQCAFYAQLSAQGVNVFGRGGKNGFDAAAYIIQGNGAYNSLFGIAPEVGKTAELALKGAKYAPTMRGVVFGADALKNVRMWTTGLRVGLNLYLAGNYSAISNIEDYLRRQYNGEDVGDMATFVGMGVAKDIFWAGAIGAVTWGAGKLAKIAMSTRQTPHRVVETTNMLGANSSEGFYSNNTADQTDVFFAQPMDVKDAPGYNEIVTLAGTIMTTNGEAIFVPANPAETMVVPASQQRAGATGTVAGLGAVRNGNLDRSTIEPASGGGFNVVTTSTSLTDGTRTVNIDYHPTIESASSDLKQKSTPVMNPKTLSNADNAVAQNVAPLSVGGISAVRTLPDGTSRIRISPDTLYLDQNEFENAVSKVVSELTPEQAVQFENTINSIDLYSLGQRIYNPGPTLPAPKLYKPQTEGEVRELAMAVALGRAAFNYNGPRGTIVPVQVKGSTTSYAIELGTNRRFIQGTRNDFSLGEIDSTVYAGNPNTGARADFGYSSDAAINMLAMGAASEYDPQLGIESFSDMSRGDIADYVRSKMPELDKSVKKDAKKYLSDVASAGSLIKVASDLNTLIPLSEITTFDMRDELAIALGHLSLFRLFNSGDEASDFAGAYMDAKTELQKRGASDSDKNRMTFLTKPLQGTDLYNGLEKLSKMSKKEVNKFFSDLAQLINSKDENPTVKTEMLESLALIKKKTERALETLRGKTPEEFYSEMEREGEILSIMLEGKFDSAKDRIERKGVPSKIDTKVQAVINTKTGIIKMMPASFAVARRAGPLAAAEPVADNPDEVYGVIHLPKGTKFLLGPAPAGADKFDSFYATWAYIDPKKLVHEDGSPDFYVEGHNPKETLEYDPAAFTIYNTDNVKGYERFSESELDVAPAYQNNPDMDADDAFDAVAPAGSVNAWNNLVRLYPDGIPQDSIRFRADILKRVVNEKLAEDGFIDAKELSDMVYALGHPGLINELANYATSDSFLRARGNRHDYALEDLMLGYSDDDEYLSPTEQYISERSFVGVEGFRSFLEDIADQIVDESISNGLNGEDDYSILSVEDVQRIFKRVDEAVSMYEKYFDEGYPKELENFLKYYDKGFYVVKDLPVVYHHRGVHDSSSGTGVNARVGELPFKNMKPGDRYVDNSAQFATFAKPRGFAYARPEGKSIHDDEEGDSYLLTIGTPKGGDLFAFGDSSRFGNRTRMADGGAVVIPGGAGMTLVSRIDMTPNHHWLIFMRDNPDGTPYNGPIDTDIKVMYAEHQLTQKKTPVETKYPYVVTRNGLTKASFATFEEAEAYQAEFGGELYQLDDNAPVMDRPPVTTDSLYDETVRSDSAVGRAPQSGDREPQAALAKRTIEDVNRDIEEVDAHIKNNIDDIREHEERIKELGPQEDASTFIPTLPYEQRKDLANSISGEDTVAMYRVQKGTPDKWRANNRGKDGQFIGRVGELKDAVWMTSDAEWAEGPDKATAGVSDLKEDEYSTVVIPVKRSDIYNNTKPGWTSSGELRSPTGEAGKDRDALREIMSDSNTKLIQTRGTDSGKQTEFILFKDDHPEVLTDGMQMMLDEYNRRQSNPMNQRGIQSHENEIEQKKQIIADYMEQKEALIRERQAIERGETGLAPYEQQAESGVGNVIEDFEAGKTPAYDPTPDLQKFNDLMLALPTLKDSPTDYAQGVLEIAKVTQNVLKGISANIDVNEVYTDYARAIAEGNLNPEMTDDVVEAFKPLTQIFEALGKYFDPSGKSLTKTFYLPTGAPSNKLSSIEDAIMGKDNVLDVDHPIDGSFDDILVDPQRVGDSGFWEVRSGELFRDENGNFTMAKAGTLEENTTAYVVSALTRGQNRLTIAANNEAARSKWDKNRHQITTQSALKGLRQADETRGKIRAAQLGNAKSFKRKVKEEMLDKLKEGFSDANTLKALDDAYEAKDYAGEIDYVRATNDAAKTLGYRSTLIIGNIGGSTLRFGAQGAGWKGTANDIRKASRINVTGAKTVYRYGEYKTIGFGLSENQKPDYGFVDMEPAVNLGNSVSMMFGQSRAGIPLYNQLIGEMQRWMEQGGFGFLNKIEDFAVQNFPLIDNPHNASWNLLRSLLKNVDAYDDPQALWLANQETMANWMKYNATENINAAIKMADLTRTDDRTIEALNTIMTRALVGTPVRTSTIANGIIKSGVLATLAFNPSPAIGNLLSEPVRIIDIYGHRVFAKVVAKMMNPKERARVKDILGDLPSRMGDDSEMVGLAARAKGKLANFIEKGEKAATWFLTASEDTKNLMFWLAAEENAKQLYSDPNDQLRHTLRMFNDTAIAGGPGTNPGMSEGTFGRLLFFLRNFTIRNMDDFIENFEEIGRGTTGSRKWRSRRDRGQAGPDDSDGGGYTGDKGSKKFHWGKATRFAGGYLVRRFLLWMFVLGPLGRSIWDALGGDPTGISDTQDRGLYDDEGTDEYEGMTTLDNIINHLPLGFVLGTLKDFYFAARRSGIETGNFLGIPDLEHDAHLMKDLKNHIPFGTMQRRLGDMMELMDRGYSFNSFGNKTYAAPETFLDTVKGFLLGKNSTNNALAYNKYRYGSMSPYGDIFEGDWLDFAMSANPFGESKFDSTRDNYAGVFRGGYNDVPTMQAAIADLRKRRDAIIEKYNRNLEQYTGEFEGLTKTEREKLAKEKRERDIEELTNDVQRLVDAYTEAGNALSDKQISSLMYLFDFHEGDEDTWDSQVARERYVEAGLPDYDPGHQVAEEKEKDDGTKEITEPNYFERSLVYQNAAQGYYGRSREAGKAIKEVLTDFKPTYKSYKERVQDLNDKMFAAKKGSSERKKYSEELEKVQNEYLEKLYTALDPIIRKYGTGTLSDSTALEELRTYMNNMIPYSTIKEYKLNFPSGNDVVYGQLDTWIKKRWGTAAPTNPSDKEVSDAIWRAKTLKDNGRVGAAKSIIRETLDRIGRGSLSARDEDVQELRKMYYEK